VVLLERRRLRVPAGDARVFYRCDRALAQPALQYREMRFFLLAWNAIGADQQPWMWSHAACFRCARGHSHCPTGPVAW